MQTIVHEFLFSGSRKSTTVFNQLRGYTHKISQNSTKKKYKEVSTTTDTNNSKDN